MSREVACSFEDAYVWYDFFGVPQVQNGRVMGLSANGGSASGRPRGLGGRGRPIEIIEIQ